MVSRKGVFQKTEQLDSKTLSHWQGGLGTFFPNSGLQYFCHSDNAGYYRSLRRRQWHPTPVPLAWKIPWTEEPVRLQSMGSLRVGHDWATSLSLFTFMHWRRKWQPTPVFLTGESQGQGSQGAAVYGVAQSRTQLKRLSSSSSSIVPFGSGGKEIAVATLTWNLNHVL